MNKQPAPITDLLRETIIASKLPLLTLQEETGVKRASIMRFVRGEQSLRLDIADKLAAYFGLELRQVGVIYHCLECDARNVPQQVGAIHHCLACGARSVTVKATADDREGPACKREDRRIRGTMIKEKKKG